MKAENRFLSENKAEGGEISAIQLPAEYRIIEKNATIPVGKAGAATIYGTHTDYTHAVAACVEVSSEESMAFDDAQGLIDYLHENMDAMSGIIEVASGTARNGGRYIYYILKHANVAEDGTRLGNSYSMNLNIQIGNTIRFVMCDFVETGTTGIRDSSIFSLCQSAGEFCGDDPFEGWSADPYDVNYRNGFLMNKSEREEYDDLFDSHPLAVLRGLKKYIVENN